MAAATAGVPAGIDPDPLLVTDLLQDVAAAGRLLGAALAREQWLDAFLVAAGILQAVDDELHRYPWRIDAAIRQVGRWAGERAQAAASRVGLLAWRLAQTRRSAVRLRQWRDALEDDIPSLSIAAFGKRLPEDYRQRLQVLVQTMEDLPSYALRSVLLQPSCFRSFDQDPADMAALAERFTGAFPQRDRPVIVVGIRTSGSYLAPLFAAMLVERGLQAVRPVSLRLGLPLHHRERTSLREVVNSGGRVALVDDPPGTGRTLRKAASALEALGVPRRAIVLIAPLFGGEDSVPESLRGLQRVVLPWEEWAIHRKLRPEAVRTAIEDCLPGHRVLAISRLELPPPLDVRKHVRALYRVSLQDARGHSAERLVLARGAGLGYFGRYALLVAERLPRFVPRVLGLRDGVLLREWLQQEAAAWPERAPALAGTLADYTAARAEAMSVAEDMSLRVRNRRAVWQLVSDQLAASFGRAAPLVRPVLHAAACRLLKVERPSVIDGCMSASHWFAGEDGAIVNVAFSDGTFASFDRACYDPVYDLACLAPFPGLAKAARERYERIAGPVDEERWLLYSLVALAREERIQGGQVPAIRRALARAIQHWFACTYFTRVAAPDEGPLCAIDIDGVLESHQLGFTAMSPASALALRALALHGYRVVLASGRSVAEVGDRCEAFGLSGGVAEYGVVISTRAGVRTLLREEERALLSVVRERLARAEGVTVNPDYAHAVRAYRFDEQGRRCSLRSETVAAALESSRTRTGIRAIPGECQTDFMAAGVDKGTALRALAEELRAPLPVELAVGDMESDLPLLALARLGFAPANAAPALRVAGVKVLSRKGPAGLTQAVAALLGHAPGDCASCARPALVPAARLLETVLTTHEVGKLGKLVQAGRLAFQLRTFA